MLDSFLSRCSNACSKCLVGPRTRAVATRPRLQPDTMQPFQSWSESASRRVAQRHHPVSAFATSRLWNSMDEHSSLTRCSMRL